METSQQSLPSMAGFQTTTDVATIGLLIQDLESLQASASNSLVLRSTQASAPVSATQLVCDLLLSVVFATRADTLS